MLASIGKSDCVENPVARFGVAEKPDNDDRCYKGNLSDPHVRSPPPREDFYLLLSLGEGGSMTQRRSRALWPLGFLKSGRGYPPGISSSKGFARPVGGSFATWRTIEMIVPRQHP